MTAVLGVGAGVRPQAGRAARANPSAARASSELPVALPGDRRFPPLECAASMIIPSSPPLRLPPSTCRDPARFTMLEEKKRPAPGPPPCCTWLHLAPPKPAQVGICCRRRREPRPASDRYLNGTLGTGCYR